MSDIELNNYNPWTDGNSSTIRNKSRRTCGPHAYTWTALLLLCLTFLVCHIIERQTLRDVDQTNYDIIRLVERLNVSLRTSQEELEKKNERRTWRLEVKLDGGIVSLRQTFFLIKHFRQTEHSNKCYEGNFK